MAEDLGAWPPEQATVLLEVLKQAGLTPQAKRTRDGILVTVPDDDAEEAQRQLVANMDAIASAARAEPRAPRRVARKKTPPAGNYGRKVSNPDRPALTSQKMTRMARPLGIVLIGLMLATIVRLPSIVIVPLTVAAVIYVVGKQAQNDRGDGV